MLRLRKGVIPPIVLGVCGVAVLLFLGTWQVQRLAWKEGLIAELEARAAAAPVALPARPNQNRDSYLRVKLSGVVEPAEINVLTSIKNVGPGFRVIAPMVLEDGRRVLVDLGYVPEVQKELSSRTVSARHSGEPVAAQVIGVLYWPVPDGLAPEPDLKRDMWFARDVPAMAQTLGTEPVMVVAAAHSLGMWPLPRPPGVDLPNNHLEYALTWFGLAIVWTIMSIVWLRSELRRRSS